MNAVTAIIAEQSNECWREAQRSAFAWRGEFIQVFAHGELAVSHTLISFSKAAGQESSGQFRQLTGQRFSDLHALLRNEKDARFRRADEALSAFRKFEAVRHTICHGSARLARFQNGTWILIFNSFTADKSIACANEFPLEEQTAFQLLVDLKGAEHRLGAALGQVRKLLAD